MPLLLENADIVARCELTRRTILYQSKAKRLYRWLMNPLLNSLRKTDNL
ncbi:hypothetical protein LCGC14_1388910 [marine sediment metagenome]|uniref:Uncharacterized protein n=1 Tax=marine sediment metagenome TaxID=412755 RepID=A0A0F9MG17_9ZZZZ